MWPRLLGQGAPLDRVVKEGLLEEVTAGQSPKWLSWPRSQGQQDLLVDGSGQPAVSGVPPGFVV